MWFVSKKKYNQLIKENEHLKQQIGAIALLYREELDSWKERSHAIEEANKIIEKYKLNEEISN